MRKARHKVEGSTLSSSAIPEGVCKPPSITSLACATCSAVSFLGRPSALSRFLAAASPAFVLSTISAHSNSASAPHHVEDQRAARRGGVDRLRERGEPGSLPPELAHRLDQVGQGAAEPVQPPHDQHVSRADRRERLVEARTPRGDAREALIGEHLVAPSSGKGVALEGEGLFVGGDPGVADFDARISQQGFASVER